MARDTHTREAMDAEEIPSTKKEWRFRFSLFDAVLMYAGPAFFIWTIFFARERVSSMYFMLNATFVAVIIEGMAFFVLSIKKRLEMQQEYILALLDSSRSMSEKEPVLTRIQLMIDMNLFHVVSLLVFVPFMGAMYFIWYGYIGRFHL